MSLNFKDCHTKIRQVDSLETTNKSVVVQVIGELSNNGQPMRRFFQTFILSPRSPTHYYVRNDIFRYQDEVFIEDDEGYTEENLDDGNHVIDDAALDAQTTVLSSSLVMNNLGNNQAQKSDKLNGQLSEQENGNNDLKERKSNSKFSCMNPEISPINTITTDLEEQSNQLNRSGSEQSIDSSTINENDKQTSTNDDEEQQKKIDSDQQSQDQLSESPVLVQQQQYEKSQPVPEPRTYATMVQRKFGQLGGSSAIIVNSIDKKDGQLIKSNEESLVNTVLNNNKKDKDDFMSSDWNFESLNTEPTPAAAAIISPTTVATTPQSTATQNHHDSKPQRNGGGNQMSDELQVFVGNLPSSIDEDQLREYFIEFGNIVDVRICQKQGKTPNYGFITFSEAVVVKKILSKKVSVTYQRYFYSNKFNFNLIYAYKSLLLSPTFTSIQPIFFNGHRINVEEKKSGRNFTSSSTGSFSGRKDKDRDHLSNRNFNSSTGSNNQFSAFSSGSRTKEDRNRGFKDREGRKSTNTTSSGNRNANLRR